MGNNSAIKSYNITMAEIPHRTHLAEICAIGGFLRFFFKLQTIGPQRESAKEKKTQAGDEAYAELKKNALGQKDFANPPKGGKWKTDTHQLFLTYSQADGLTKKIIHENLLRIFEGYTIYGVICQERHKDKGIHFHVYVFIKERYLKTIATTWDIRHNGRNYHPHVSSVRKLQAVLRYITKEDKNTLSFGDITPGVKFDVAISIGSRDKKSSYGAGVVIQMIQDGADIYEIDDKMPQEVFKNPGRIKNYIHFQAEKSRKRKVWDDFPGFKVPASLTVEEGWRQYAMELNTVGKERTFRQKQLYIWSDQKPHLGKTYPVLVTLAKFFPVFVWNKTAKYQNDDVVDAKVILMDDLAEGGPGFTISEIKALLQGGRSCKINIKNERDVTLREDCMFVLTANISPEELLRRMGASEHLMSFVDRLHVIKVSKYCELHLNEPVSDVPVFEGLPQLLPSIEPVRSQRQIEGALAMSTIGVHPNAISTRLTNIQRPEITHPPTHTKKRRGDDFFQDLEREDPPSRSLDIPWVPGTPPNSQDSTELAGSTVEEGVVPPSPNQHDN